MDCFLRDRVKTGGRLSTLCFFQTLSQNVNISQLLHYVYFDRNSGKWWIATLDIEGILCSESPHVGEH